MSILVRKRNHSNPMLATLHTTQSKSFQQSATTKLLRQAAKFVCHNAIVSYTSHITLQQPWFGRSSGYTEVRQHSQIISQHYQREEEDDAKGAKSKLIFCGECERQSNYVKPPNGMRSIFKPINYYKNGGVNHVTGSTRQETSGLRYKLDCGGIASCKPFM